MGIVGLLLTGLVPYVGLKKVVVVLENQDIGLVVVKPERQIVVRLLVLENLNSERVRGTIVPKIRLDAVALSHWFLLLFQGTNAIGNFHTFS